MNRLHVFLLLVLAIAGAGVISLKGCNNEKNYLQKEIERYPCAIEMIIDESKAERLIELILEDDRGIEKLAELYFIAERLRKHIAILSWELSFRIENRSSMKKELVGLLFFLLSDKDLQVRGLAGAALAANLYDFVPEDVFKNLLIREGLEAHGVRGLLRIGVPNTIEIVLETVEEKRQDKELWGRLISVMCQEGLPGETKGYIADLLEKGALDELEAIKDICKEALSNSGNSM